MSDWLTKAKKIIVNKFFRHFRQFVTTSIFSLSTNFFSSPIYSFFLGGGVKKYKYHYCTNFLAISANLGQLLSFVDQYFCPSFFFRGGEVIKIEQSISTNFSPFEANWNNFYCCSQIFVRWDGGVSQINLCWNKFWIQKMLVQK